MKKLLSTLLFICLFLAPSFSQIFSEQEIGIVEHLNDTIPMDLVFFNEKNEQVRLGDLIDGPTVLAFVYFNCPSICNPLQEGLAEVIEKTDLELGKDYKVITISFDYRDTPDQAVKKKRNFTTKIGDEKARYWYYLTGDSATIAKILGSVGYKIKVAGLDYIHPSALVVVSPKGKITRYLYGLRFMPFDLKMAVIEAQKGLSRPTVNRILEYCFTYEPEGRKYGLQVTKIVGTLTIFILGIFFLILVLRRKKQANK
jgi:protein SCO1/2